MLESYRRQASKKPPQTAQRHVIAVLDKSAKSLVPTQRDVFIYSPAPSLVAVVRSFYKHMRKRAFSNLHSIAALRIASHATSQCVCLRVHACEYTCVPSLNDCELQFGVGVVQCEFMLQNRARNPKLRPSADGHRSDSLTYEPE